MSFNDELAELATARRDHIQGCIDDARAQVEAGAENYAHTYAITQLHEFVMDLTTYVFEHEEFNPETGEQDVFQQFGNLIATSERVDPDGLQAMFDSAVEIAMG
jgi:hypothetical protein